MINKNTFNINNNIYLNLSEIRGWQLSDIVKAVAHHIENGLDLKVHQSYLKCLDQPRSTLSLMELEAFSKISQSVRKKIGNDISALKNELEVIEKLRKVIISGLEPQNEESLKNQIPQINNGQIKIYELLKGFTAKEAIEWIVNHPAAKDLEIADFRGFIINDLDNENLNALTKTCPNLKHLYIGEMSFEISGDALKFLEWIPKLESLSILSMVKLTPDSLKYLVHTPSLKFLDIAFCPFEPDSLKYLKYTPELQILKAKCSKFSDSLKYLEYVPKLKSLDISNCSKVEEDALKNLIFTPKLLHLNIRSCEGLKLDSLKHLVYVKLLQSLNISGCSNLEGDCLKYLEYVPNLKKLIIKWCWDFNPDVLKNLFYVPDLRCLKLFSCWNLESDALKNLEYVPLLLELDIANCNKFEADALKHLKHTIYLQNLNISSCRNLDSNSFEYLRFTPDLRSLDISQYLQLEKYALKPLMFHSHLKSIKCDSRNIVDMEHLPLALKKDMSAPLEKMSDWNNFIVRDKTWDQLSIYNTNGTQEPYGRRMQQAIVVVSELIKNNASFDEVCKCARNLRQIIAIELDHPYAGKFGVARTAIYHTDIKKSLYEDIGIAWKDKHEQIRNIKRICPFYNLDKAMVMGSINEKNLELSYVDFNTMLLYHTDPSSISVIMDYVEDLYAQANNENDSVKVQEIAGLMFWWICQAKPWERGDPSIAEIMVRAIFDAKEIPNLPWKEKIVPWAEATKEFEPVPFSKNFQNLFDDIGNTIR